MVWVTPTPGEFNQLCLTVTKKWTPCQTFWAHCFKGMTDRWRLHVRKFFATHWWGVLWQPHPSRKIPLRHTLTNIIFRGTKYPMIGHATILFDELFPLPKWHHLIYIYMFPIIHKCCTIGNWWTYIMEKHTTYSKYFKSTQQSWTPFEKGGGYPFLPLF